MNVPTAMTRLFGANLGNDQDHAPGHGPALIEPETWIQLAFQHQPTALALVGPDLRLHWVNTALCNLFEYQEAELQDQTLQHLLSTGTADGHQPMADPTAECCAASVRVEQECRTRTGRLLWCALTFTRIPSGQGPLELALLSVEDITRQKQRLQSALDFRDRMLTEGTCALLVLNEEGRIVLASRRAAALTGYSHEELVGLSIDRLWPSADTARLQEQLSRTLREATPVSHIETKIVCGVEGARNVLLNLQPLSLDSGGAGALAIVQDISERKIAEQALRESEDRYRDLVENSGLLIGMHSLDGTILSVNQSLVRAVGATGAADLIGGSIGDLLAPDVQHLFADYLTAIREAGHAQGVMRIVTRGGEERIIAYDNSVRTNGLASPIVRCFGHDVTDRVYSARALRDSEARYRTLFEDNPAMYFTVDPDGTILSVNQFGAAQLGYEPADLVGHSVLRVFHEEDRPEVQQQMTACLHNPTAVAYWEFRKVRRDGSVLWVREAARAVQGPAGGVQVLIVCEDITEHRQVEQALREGEARLRALGDNLPNGAVYQLVKERDGTMRFPYMSAGSQQLLGVAAEEARHAHNVFERIEPEDQARMLSALDESMRTLSVLDIEVRRRVQPDQVQWIQFRAAPRRTRAGATLWDGVMVDVTEARRDLEALLQTVGGIVWESEGDLSAETMRDTFVSAQAERLLGYPLQDWTEQPTFWIDHVVPDDRADVLARRQAALEAGRNYEIDYRMRTREGRLVWLRDIVNVVARDGTRVKLRGISVDVTESKRAEAALRESEERFRTLADNMPAALFIYRGDQWVYVNPAAELVTGYQRAQLLDMKVWQLVHEESRGYVRERLEQRQRGGSLPARGELRLVTRSGREHWIEFITTPIVFEGEASVLVTGFDITERRLAEAALRESQEALHRSHERARELTGRLMLLQEEERRRISRELHDDVNQKVAALAITISRLRQESDELVRDQLTGLQHRMTALSEDVRQLSHQLHPAALEHTGLVTSLRSFCAEFTQQEGIQVTLSIREGCEAIPLDRALSLYRITQESLRNVAKHAGTCTVRVTLGADDHGIHMMIADTGTGFDPDKIRHKGGLGLVSMEERVRLLRGRLEVKSRPRAGTEIHVHLPASRD